MNSFALTIFLCLPVARAAGACVFNLQGRYSSADFPDHDLSELRSDTGTINGPLPVQPNAPDEQYNYDVDGYIKSFKKIGVDWVRFQDLGMTQGGTSLSQIFTAWPRNDDDLEKADVTQLTSDTGNFNFTSVDMFVKAAVVAGAKLDYRLGDSHQIASLLQEGKPIPVGENTISFPKAWGFPTNIETEKGMELWTHVALRVAKHVWELVGADENQVVFDLLTETTDGNCFWPSSAVRYAQLYSRVMTEIKSQLGTKVQCVGANTMSPMKPGANGDDPWIVTFFKECNKMGYQKCPLDVVAFHVFSPTAAELIPKNARWVLDQMKEHLTNFQVKPGLAMTAWGFHGSGMYDYNKQPLGAAMMANALIAVENTPLKFMIYYKWAGINCKNLQSPCLVVNVPGTLKPPAIPFMFHTRMSAIGKDRIIATCEGANVIAIRSKDNKTTAAMIAPAKDGVAPAPLHIKTEHMTCATNSVTLTLEYVDSSAANDSSAITNTIKVTGKLGDDDIFVADGDKEAYTVPESRLSFAALLTLSCTSGDSDMVIV